MIFHPNPLNIMFQPLIFRGVSFQDLQHLASFFLDCVVKVAPVWRIHRLGFNQIAGTVPHGNSRQQQRVFFLGGIRIWIKFEDLDH